MDPKPDPRLSCLRLSSQPPLTREQVRQLPAGSIVLRRYKDGPWWTYWISEPATEHRSPRAHVWIYGPGWGEWSKATEPLGAEVEIRYPKLPRISVRLTEEAVRTRRKTVTRRLKTPTWCKPGALALVVDRVRSAGAIGLAVVEIVSADRMRLDHISREEVEKEGFPDWSCLQFLEMFHQETGARFEDEVTRIEWRYL